MQGHPLKVLKALEGVVGHLRKFLVDHSVISLFEKSVSKANFPLCAYHIALVKHCVEFFSIVLFQHSSSAALGTQDRVSDAWPDKASSLMQTSQMGMGGDYSHPSKRDSLYFDREAAIDSRMQHSGLSLYGQDPAISGLGSSGMPRTSGAFVTQVGKLVSSCFIFIPI